MPSGCSLLSLPALLFFSDQIFHPHCSLHASNLSAFASPASLSAQFLRASMRERETDMSLRLMIALRPLLPAPAELGGKCYTFTRADGMRETIEEDIGINGC